MTCLTCSNPLAGKQTKFCSIECKTSNINVRHKAYAVQHGKGLERKKDLVAAKGGRCERCGYSKNIAALCFHHLRDKLFQITLRECANRSPQALADEAAKCELLCHNCHMEEHHPDLEQSPATV